MKNEGRKKIPGMTPGFLFAFDFNKLIVKDIIEYPATKAITTTLTKRT